MITRGAAKADVMAGRARHRCVGLGEVKGTFSSFECRSCKSTWSLEQMLWFSTDEIRERFFVREVYPREDAVALVWVTDPVTKRRYTSLVKAYEAGDRERVKV